MVWCGVAWCDVAWCGVMSCGVVWYGMVNSVLKKKCEHKLVSSEPQACANVVVSYLRVVINRLITNTM